MQPVAGNTNLFQFDGRTLQLTGRRKDPILLKDDKTGEVLWDRAKNTKFSNSWARNHFKISTSCNTVTITDKKRDCVVCECVAVDHAEGDPFLMQVSGPRVWNAGREIARCLHCTSCCASNDVQPALTIFALESSIRYRPLSWSRFRLLQSAIWRIYSKTISRLCKSFGTMEHTQVVFFSSHFSLCAPHLPPHLTFFCLVCSSHAILSLLQATKHLEMQAHNCTCL